MQPKQPRRPVIGVIGSASASPKVAELAEELGERIAQAGCDLVCGGMGGVMEAACRGAARVGAETGTLTIGILPGADPAAANQHLDVVVPTGIGLARNALVVLASMGVIAVHGGAGTLSEIAYAWQLGRPIAVLQPSGGWAQRMAGIQIDDRRPDQRVEPFENAAEAVDWLTKGAPVQPKSQV